VHWKIKNVLVPNWTTFSPFNVERLWFEGVHQESRDQCAKYPKVKHSNIICRYSKAYHLSKIRVALITYGADNSPTHTTMWGPVGQWALSRYRILNSCKFFQTGFLYSNRRQYSGRSGYNFTNNYWKPWLLSHRRRGSVQLVIWGTAINSLPMRFPTFSSGSYLDALWLDSSCYFTVEVTGTND
jgi:hypothetical protein